MTNHHELAYSLLRTPLGVIFLFAGIGKFMGGFGIFVGGMNQHFSGKLPAALVMPFAYVLPFAEVILGLLILLGLFTTFALALSGLLFVALSFGTVILGDFPTVAHNLQYAFVNFVLLWLVNLNRYSIDHSIGRGATAHPPKSVLIVLCCALSFGTVGLYGGATVASARSDFTQSSVPLRFRLNAGESKFIAHGLRGGLFWFKGHEHLVAAREFSGEAQITPDNITPASLRLTVKTDSMAETSDVFTEPQKQIINKELREIVLEPAKYPEIVFKSTEVKGKALGNSQYDLKISGDLTLHGVTRRIEIPAKVTLTGNSLRAVGEFSIDRSDFNVKATSAFHGLVRVRNQVKFTFDILGHRI
jgi:thiosulfate dehydrogenase [quinone] large subunit